MRPTLRALALVLGLVTLLAAPAAAQAPTWTIEHEDALTQDGEVIAAMRFKNPGQVPVILFPGIGANLHEFHLPSMSFAAFLADQGWDVWLFTTRGTGDLGFVSTGGADSSFDDLYLDVDAAVKEVRRVTGERPFLGGHSQGGMMALAYLEGVEKRLVPVRTELRLSLFGIARVTVQEERIASDPALAQARNAGVRGLVALASPARLAWPARVTSWSFWQASYWDYNLLLEELSRSLAANLATYVVPVIPGADVRDFITDDLTQLPFVGPFVRPFLREVTRAVGPTFLLAQLMRPGSLDAQVAFEGLDRAVDDIPTASFRQFMGSIRRQDHLELHQHDALRAPYSYAARYDLVTAPTIWVAGTYDKLANHAMIEAAAQTLGSADKTVLKVPNGHIDVVLGRNAPADCWAPVEAWMRARR